MITDEDKERVRQATDIVQLVSETVVLRPRGGNDFWGCCPFHQEKSPSFHVTPSTGLWHCFGCGAGGDVFDYVMKREGLDFLDAVRYLADRAHIDIDDAPAAPGQRRGPKRTRLLDALAAAQGAYTLRLMRGRGEGPDAARHYLAGRGLNSKVCAKWHLGYADGNAPVARSLEQAGFSRDELISADLANARNGRLRDQFFNRVMFPIHDEQGRCIGFGGRVMGDAKPKYLNTRETSVFHKSKHMFAFDYAKDSIAAKGVAIVNEGYMDVIAMHEAGFTNTVAALGTALSLDHVKTLSRFAKRIICMFDGDAAGQHAAEAAVRYIESTKASLECVVLPDNQDPDEFLKAHGAEAMQAQLDGARPLLDFVLDKKLSTLDLSSPGLRLAALDELAKLLAPFKDSYLLDGYAQRLCVPLGMSLEAVREKIRATPIEDLERAATGSRFTGNRVSSGGPSHAGGFVRGGFGRAGDSGRGFAGSGSSGTARPMDAGDDAPPYYGDEGIDEVPYDYDDVPIDVPGQDFSPAASASSTGADVPLSALSSEERTQLTAERNLLTMLSEKPDLFRPYAERIGSFVWADARHEAIAWAILATPQGTTPAEAVQAATRACPDAPRILSSGGFAFTSAWSDEKNVEFVVNEAEIRSLDRRVSLLAAKISAVGSGADSLESLKELSELRHRRSELRAAQPLE